MLTTLDKNLLASINLHAVFGALPKLVELVPAAAKLIAPLERPVTLSLVSPGDHVKYTFSSSAIRVGGSGKGPTLLFRSAGHVNRVVAGASQPIPVAGVGGIKFLTGVFTPLTDILSSYLEPEPGANDDPEFAKISTLLTFEVVASALVLIANNDEAGKVSAEHMPDGTLDIEVGDEHRYRLGVANHKLHRVRDIMGDPSAALHFSSLQVAGDVLAGRRSSLAAMAAGDIAMRGMIPLVDNTNRLLDRVGAYLGA